MIHKLNPFCSSVSVTFPRVNEKHKLEGLRIHLTLLLVSWIPQTSSVSFLIITALHLSSPVRWAQPLEELSSPKGHIGVQSMAKSRKRRGKGDQFCLQARLVWKTAWSHRAPGLTVRAGVTPSSAQRDQVCKSAGKDAEHLLTMCVEGPAPQTWVSQGHHEAIIFTNTLSKPS